MSESAANTVYIVDDDEAIRSGLSLLLRSYGYEPRAFPSGSAFLEHCNSAPLPDRCMAILDLSMPVMDGLELQSELRRRHVNLPVVFLSGDGNIPVAVNAIQHGAVDFIEKPVVTDLLLDRVEDALKLCAYGDGGDDEAAEIQTRIQSLTSREREVLNGITGGGTSKAIAAEMGISERTVELHRSRILRKMGVRNSTELLNLVMPVLGAEETREN